MNAYGPMPIEKAIELLKEKQAAQVKGSEEEVIVILGTHPH